MKYVKLVSDGTWFDVSTEVFSSRPNEYETLDRMTKEEFEEWKQGFILVRGYKEGKLDEEVCSLDEFEITFVDKFE